MVELYAKATPRPWRVVNYDAGDRSYYNFTPSIQAPEEEDCAVVHWDGFEQEYWQSAHGDQRAIHANAALIVHAVNNIEAREARIVQLEAALAAILKVEVQGWENIWAGSNRCKDIARTALQNAGCSHGERAKAGQP